MIVMVAFSVGHLIGLSDCDRNGLQTLGFNPPLHDVQHGPTTKPFRYSSHNLKTSLGVADSPFSPSTTHETGISLSAKLFSLTSAGSVPRTYWSLSFARAKWSWPLQPLLVARGVPHVTYVPVHHCFGPSSSGPMRIAYGLDKAAGCTCSVQASWILLHGALWSPNRCLCKLPCFAFCSRSFAHCQACAFVL